MDKFVFLLLTNIHHWLKRWVKFWCSCQLGTPQHSYSSIGRRSWSTHPGDEHISSKWSLLGNAILCHFFGGFWKLVFLVCFRTVTEQQQHTKLQEREERKYWRWMFWTFFWSRKATSLVYVAINHVKVLLARTPRCAEISDNRGRFPLLWNWTVENVWYRILL